MSFAILLLIPLYALADRFAGGGWPWLDSKLPGRAAFWGALACAGAGYLLAGPFGALAGLAWLIWRTPAWKVFGGSAAPTTGREIGGTLLRHLIVIPLLLLASYWTGHDLLLTGAGASAFALVATVLAIVLAHQVMVAEALGQPLGDDNTWIELARGAAFGVVIAIIGGLP